jgi:RNA polymerase sigma factor for flagellar operon FliA
MVTTVSGPNDVDRMWAAYRATGDRSLRDQLVLSYSSLVKQVASRVAMGLPSSVDRSDLVSAGTVGLLEAIERFDLDRGVSFESYAVGRIRGAIVDELRAADWVPRSVRAKARAVEAAYQELEARLHRVPTDAELARAAGMTLEQLQTALGEISATGLVALEEATSLGDVLADRTEGPDGLLEEFETREVLATTVKRLPERERTVLVSYYVDGLTLAQIGARLGVTESRVSQIHAKALLHLRARLAAADRSS